MNLLTRIGYAWQQALKHQDALKTFNAPSFQLQRLIEFPVEGLLDPSLGCLVLDFDGVMASHGKIEPHPEVMAWLERIRVAQLSHKVVILSNKPLPARIEFMKAHFPLIEFVLASAKKPYPDGLIQIMKERQLPADALVLVDDRLLTGMLASLGAGTRGLWVQYPYQDFKFAPIREAFFAILRGAETLWNRYSP